MYAERQVVIYAIVDKDGKISQVAVKKTPDRRGPAQVNGQPTAVKVLIGNPLS